MKTYHSKSTDAIKEELLERKFIVMQVFTGEITTTNYHWKGLEKKDNQNLKSTEGKK